MTFPEIKDTVEEILLRQGIQSQLLELHYLAYSFGSGFVAYRINGFNIKFSYDGKDGFLSVAKSSKHAKYSDCNWYKLYDDKPPQSDEEFQSLVLSLIPTGI